ncbi:hypothetical protein BD779DRAFT_1480067 [Infundibulicybe gibba]|nr:hypothetical protein BD779DRAFT_1480067 [Infundibulicybe gibba]
MEVSAEPLLLKPWSALWSYSWLQVDIVKTRIIKSQEEADKLHHAARAQRDTCEEAVKEAEAQISAAILRRQRAEEKLFQADRYIGKIRSLIHRTGFSCCPPDSTLARPPPLPVEIYGDSLPACNMEVQTIFSRDDYRSGEYKTTSTTKTHCPLQIWKFKQFSPGMIIGLVNTKQPAPPRLTARVQIWKFKQFSPGMIVGLVDTKVATLLRLRFPHPPHSHISSSSSVYYSPQTTMPKKKGKRQRVSDEASSPEPDARRRKVSRRPKAQNTNQAADGRRCAPPTVEGTAPRMLPQRVTRGKGGAIEQLQLVGRSIRPDLEEPEQRLPTEGIPGDVLVNPMAPSSKRQRGSKDPILLPRRQEPTLADTAPAPVLQSAKPWAGYGFTIDNTYPTPNSTRNARAGANSLHTRINDEQIDPQLHRESQHQRIYSSTRHLPSKTNQSDEEIVGPSEDDLNDWDHSDDSNTNKDTPSDGEMTDEQVIDEVSSSEDERNAMKVVQDYWLQGESPLNDATPIQGSDEHSGSEDEVDVLTEYRNRNRPTRAPNPEYLNFHRRNSALDNSNAFNQHAGTSAQLDNANSDQQSEPRPRWRARAPRHSRTPYNQPSALLMEAISDHEKNQGTVEEGYLREHKKDMILLDRGSSFRHQMKDIAQELIKNYYNLFPSADDLPQGQGEYQAMIGNRVSQLLQRGNYLHTQDKSGHTDNFGHPALRELCVRFFYGKTESMGRMFPKDFSEKMPLVAIALAGTCVRFIH